MSGLWIDILLIVLTTAALVSNLTSPARVFGIFILAVLATGRLPVDVAARLLAEPAILTVTALIIMASALNKLPLFQRMFFFNRSKPVRLTLLRMLGLSAICSAVAPNTAVVATVMGPASRRPGAEPHTLLLPLSYASLAGGMIMPFGTSASLLLVGRASSAGVELNVIDFVVPGLGVTAVVVILLILLAPIILKSRPGETTETRSFLIEAAIPVGSTLIGKSVAEAGLRGLQSHFLAEIARGDRLISAVGPTTRLQAGDSLIFTGNVHHLDELRSIKGLVTGLELATARQDNTYQAVIAPGSPLVGATLKDSRFRAQFDASVLAIHRGQEQLSGKLGEVRLKAGDLLVLAAGSDFPTRDDLRSNFYLLDEDNPAVGRLDKWNGLALLIGFGTFVVAAVFQLVPLALAATILTGIAVLMNWVTPREVRRIFPFDIVVVLWGAIILGELVMRSGLAGEFGAFIGSVAGDAPPALTVAIIFSLTWLLTEFFSNASAALIGLPIALATSAATGLPAEALALAAAFGASAGFLMPFGYQTHLMVMSPGRYNPFDFLRLGIPILVIYGVTATLLISVTQL